MTRNYKAAAQSLAASVVTLLGVSSEIERHLSALDDFARKWDDADVALERALIVQAWERERTHRRNRCECIDCGRSAGRHDARCPRYHDAPEAAERR